MKKLLPLAFALYATTAAASNITDYLEQHGKKNEDEDKIMYMLDVTPPPGYATAAFKLMERKEGVKLGLSLMKVVEDHVEMKVIVDVGADGSVEESYAGAGKNPEELEQTFDSVQITQEDRQIYSDAYKMLEQIVAQAPLQNSFGKTIETYLISHNAQVVDVHNGKLYNLEMTPPPEYDSLTLSYEDSTDRQRIIVQVMRKATANHDAKQSILLDNSGKKQLDAAYTGEGKNDSDAHIALNRNVVGKKNDMTDDDKNIYAYVLQQVQK